MTQKDYILRVAEDVSRASAQIIYHKEIHDYQRALSLIDELFKQAVGAGSDFIHVISEETLLAMLTFLGILNVEKALMIATLLNVAAGSEADPTTGISKRVYFLAEWDGTHPIKLFHAFDVGSERAEAMVSSCISSTRSPL